MPVSQEELTTHRVSLIGPAAASHARAFGGLTEG
jgi:hypothetical protein